MAKIKVFLVSGVQLDCDTKEFFRFANGDREIVRKNDKSTLTVHIPYHSIERIETRDANV